MEENQIPAEKEARPYSVPWSVGDTWLGVGLLVVLFVALVIVLLLGLIDARFIQSAGSVLIELIFLLPVALIFALRRIHWKALGFGAFPLKTLGIGIILLFAGYIIIIPHNYLLTTFGMDTQGDQVFEIFGKLESPVWFVIAGALVAPVVEEIFFRGFLLQGFRQTYGWVSAILLSSFIFASAHLDPVAFLPTFVLGFVLAYMYHISNSIWPGIIFHAVINSFGFAFIYFALQNPSLIPS